MSTPPTMIATSAGTVVWMPRIITIAPYPAAPAAAATGRTCRRSISRPSGTRDAPFANDWDARIRPTVPAPRPIPVPNSGNMPLTAPQGMPIASAASQVPTIARWRATSPIIAGSLARRSRPRAVGGRNAAITTAERPMPAATTNVGAGPPQSHTRPPIAGPKATPVWVKSVSQPNALPRAAGRALCAM